MEKLNKAASKALTEDGKKWVIGYFVPHPETPRIFNIDTGRRTTVKKNSQCLYSGFMVDNEPLFEYDTVVDRLGRKGTIYFQNGIFSLKWEGSYTAELFREVLKIYRITGNSRLV